MFESSGYLRITDLGIGRIWKPDNSSGKNYFFKKNVLVYLYFTDTSGTPGYMAPEVMCR